MEIEWNQKKKIALIQKKAEKEGKRNPKQRGHIQKEIIN